MGFSLNAAERYAAGLQLQLALTERIVDMRCQQDGAMRLPHHMMMASQYTKNVLKRI